MKFGYDVCDTSEYRTWFSMKSRCLNSEDPGYKNYGGRGITIYKKWINSFDTFYKYMGDKPGNQYTIDRIDVNGNYEPGNVRWATRKQQTRNRRNTTMITYDGEIKALADWCEKFKLDYESIRKRIKLGWTFERAMTEEKNNPTRIIENKTVKELAEDNGMKKSVLSNRINLGWSIDKCLNTPVEEKEWEIEYNGKTQNMKAWAKELNIPYKALHLRITRYKWDIQKAFTTPIDNKLEFNGDSLTLGEWSAKLNIPYATLHHRINGYGWSIEKALTKPLGKQSKVYK